MIAQFIGLGYIGLPTAALVAQHGILALEVFEYPKIGYYFINEVISTT